MGTSLSKIENSIGRCGLVCLLCEYTTSGECQGCRDESSTITKCTVRKCCISKGYVGCWECNEFPCNEKMFKQPRVCAFVKCIKEEGISQFSQYIKRNCDNGIIYSDTSSSKGAYNLFDREEDVLNFLKQGNL